MGIFYWGIVVMGRIYFIVGVAAFILFAYWTGMRMGRAQCAADIAHNVINQNNQNQSDLIKTVEKINAETYKTGVDDIRDILRRQYTIAE